MKIRPYLINTILFFERTKNTILIYAILVTHRTTHTHTKKNTLFNNYKLQQNLLTN